MSPLRLELRVSRRKEARAVVQRVLRETEEGLPLPRIAQLTGLGRKEAARALRALESGGLARREEGQLITLWMTTR